MISDVIHLVAGQTFSGTGKTIHAHGSVSIMGSSCTIYANNSNITGSSLIINGDGNTITGSSNKIYGNNNNITGSSNIENGILKTTGPPRAASMYSVFNQFSALCESSHFEGKQSPLIGTLNHYGGTVNYQSSSPSVEVKTVITPTRPSEEELKNDEEADGGEDSCVICFERKRKCVIRPCKHFSLCVTCSRKKLDECPICRVKITSIESLFT